MFQVLYAPAADHLLPLLTSLEYHALVALPLVLLAFTLTWLWPLAIAAVLLPPGLCGFAALRTSLPRARVRWWSRPVLAWLHYVQPIVRAGARYRARLGLPSRPTSAAASLEAEARVYASAPVRERAYWSATWRERSEWIARMVVALERHGWPCQVDSGWEEFDLEVFGARWARMAVVTAAEATRDRGQLLRCRLAPRWTLAAHLTFWGVLAAELVAAGIFDVNGRGAWIPVVSLAVLAWFFRWQGRVLQCQLSVVLDEVARDWGLVIKPDRVSN
jgi:hypothetical protein